MNSSVLDGKRQHRNMETDICSLLIISALYGNEETRKPMYRLVAKFFIDELLPMLKRRKITFRDFASPPICIALLAFLADTHLVTKAIARKVLAIMCTNATDTPIRIIADNGWIQLDKRAEIEPLVDAAMHEHPKAVEDYRGGKHAAANVLMGAVMRLCNGRANPDVLNEVLEERLNEQAGEGCPV